MNQQVDKRIIGFDLDGVIIDHTKSRIKFAKKQGWDLKPEQTHPEILKNIIPNEHLREIQKLLYYHSKFSLLSNLMAGAKNGLMLTKKKKIPFFLISRRRSSGVAIKFLKHHGFWPAYFNKKNSFFVLEPEDKNQKAAELGITHYIDDELNVLDKLVDVRNRFLFDYLNIFKKSDRYIRVSSWKELIGHIL